MKELLAAVLTTLAYCILLAGYYKEYRKYDGEPPTLYKFALCAYTLLVALHCDELFGMFFRR